MFCVILQGLPGSGKTTLANILKALPDVIVCSADDYFVNKATGIYRFDATRLYDAHQTCYDKFMGLCNTRNYNIVVDNTNVSKDHYKRYVDFAKLRGYTVMVVQVKTDLTDEDLAARNVHKVPVETIKRMRTRLND